MNPYEFDKKTREIIYERDKRKCVYCHSAGMLGVAHVFIPRSKGGLGIEENGVLLCQRCHHEMDNGKNEVISDMVKLVCESYLEAQYEIDLKKIKHNKWKGYKYE